MIRVLNLSSNNIQDRDLIRDVVDIIELLLNHARVLLMTLLISYCIADNIEEIKLVMNILIKS